MTKLEEYRQAAEAASEHPICKLCNLVSFVSALCDMVKQRDKALEVAMAVIEAIKKKRVFKRIAHCSDEEILKECDTVLTRIDKILEGD